MLLFTAEARSFVENLSHLAYANPFSPERITWERAALGDDFDDHLADWNVRAGAEAEHPNVIRLIERAKQTLVTVHGKAMERGSRQRDISPRDVSLYEDLVLFVLYHQYREAFDRLVAETPAKGKSEQVRQIFRQMHADAMHWLDGHAAMIQQSEHLPHVFAGFFQIRRAFNNIYSYIVGSSQIAVKLRASVWQSIFTHDMRRYRRVLFDRMSDYSTLITGPSGTGKELVARAIGLSRYVPFDAVAHKFTDDIDNTFFAVNLSALSPTLIESELFGHQRGAYTGALTERCGWLEVCPPSGTVFLDEIGELDGAIQVKLLRVLQSREFSRLGETQSRRFLGKIIAATNRNLAVEIHAGTFREDLYYRLCSDLVSVPSLRARLDDNPQELAELVLHIAQRLVGPEAAAVATEVLTVINQQLGPNYPWPGNIRELEQCVRNVLIRQSYRNDFLASRATSDDPFVQLAETMRLGQLTAEQLLTRYCQLAYAQTGSYEATARQLQLDRRTVKAKVISATNP